MSDNDYSVLTERLRSELLASLSTMYTGLVVVRQVFKPERTPQFTRYAIVISPPLRSMWEEKRETLQSIAYVMRVDLFLLVKNFDEEGSLFGTISPDLGLFQMVADVKEYIRYSNLGGLITKTYDEPGGQNSGSVSIDFGATPGFEAAEQTFVRRAQLPCRFEVKSFCYPRNFS